MRYVKQRVIDLNKSQVQQSRSDQIKQSKNMLNPELHSFAAVHKYKQAQDHVEEVKHRISALKIQEQKNINRIRENQRKMKMHELVQNQTQQQKQKLKKYIENLNQKIEEQRYMNERDRINRKQSFQMTKDIIQSQRSMEFHLSRQKSLEIQRNINQFRNQNLMINRAKRDHIADMESSIRQNLKKSAINKKLDITKDKINDVSNFQNKKQQKQSQLSQLTRLEAQMLQRQSRSRMVCEESQKRLQYIRKQSKNKFRIGKQREIKSEKVENRLPSIHKKSKDSQIIVI